MSNQKLSAPSAKQLKKLMLIGCSAVNESVQKLDISSEGLDKLLKNEQFIKQSINSIFSSGAK